MATNKNETKKNATGKSNPKQKKVLWDDENMRTTFANVVNGTSTREEVSLFFGTNKTWNLTEEKDVKVQLSDRIILTPHAAKRMATLLTTIIAAYEKNYGPVKLELPVN